MDAELSPRDAGPVSEPLPPPHPLDGKWHIRAGDKNHGPYTGHRIKQFIEEGRVRPGTPAIQVDGQDWTELGKVPVFAPLFRAHQKQQPTVTVKIDQSFPHRGLRVHGPEYAGFWIRVAANFLDTLVFVVIGLVLGVAGMLVMGDGFADSPIMNVISTVVGVAYFALMHAGGWQATLGKRACGIHLQREDGSHVGVGRGIGRYFAMILSGLPFGIGFMMAGWTDQKKALHDMICGTRVVYGRL